MKKLFILGLITILTVPLFLIGCDTEEPPTTIMPALNGGQEAKMIELSIDDFMTQNNITQNIEIVRPGSLIVSLGSNPTTGYEWGETARISDTSVIKQVEHNFVGSETEKDVVGAGGKDVWTFDSVAPGTATINMSYSRPWEGGEKDAWTMTINVNVK